jgi:hypothetical protein
MKAAPVAPPLGERMDRLLNVRQPYGLLQLKMYLGTLLPALAFVYTWGCLFGMPNADVDPHSFWMWFGAVVFAPAVETLIMGWIAELLRNLRLSIMTVSLVSGVLWGVLHGFFEPANIVPSGYGFFVYTWVYLRCSEYKGSRFAFTTVTLSHALHNLTLCVGALFGL